MWKIKLWLTLKRAKGSDSFMIKEWLYQKKTGLLRHYLGVIKILLTRVPFPLTWYLIPGTLSWSLVLALQTIVCVRHCWERYCRLRWSRSDVQGNVIFPLWYVVIEKLFEVSFFKKNSPSYPNHSKRCMLQRTCIF